MKRDYQNFVNKVRSALKNKNPTMPIELINPINQEIVSKIASDALTITGDIVDGSIFQELAFYMDINNPTKKVFTSRITDAFLNRNNIDLKFNPFTEKLSNASLIFINSEPVAQNFKTSLLKLINEMTVGGKQKIIYFTTKDTIKNFYQYLGVKNLKTFIEAHLKEYDTEEKVNALIKRLLGTDKLDALYITSKLGLNESKVSSTPSGATIREPISPLYKEYQSPVPFKLGELGTPTNLPVDPAWARFYREGGLPDSPQSTAGPSVNPSFAPTSAVPETATTPTSTFGNIVSGLRNMFSTPKPAESGYYVKLLTSAQKNQWGLGAISQGVAKFALYETTVYRITKVNFKNNKQKNGMQSIDLLNGGTIAVNDNKLRVIGDVTNSQPPAGYTFIRLDDFEAQAATDVMQKYGNPLKKIETYGSGLTGGSFTKEFNITSFEFVGQSGSDKVYKIIVN
jgi:hypothetical protein